MLVLRIADLSMVAAAFYLSQFWPDGREPTGSLFEWKGPLLFALLAASIIFERFDLYRPWRGHRISAEARTLSAAWITLLASLATLQWFIRPQAYFPAIQTLIFAAGGWALLLVLRLLLRSILRNLRRRGLNQRHAILVGMGVLGTEVYRQLTNAPWTGIQVLGYFDDRDTRRLDVPNELPCLGPIKQLPDYLEHRQIDQIWICLPFGAETRVRSVLHELRHSTADIRYALDVAGFNPLNYSLSEIAGIPVLNISTTPLSGLGRLVKEIEDRVFACLALGVLMPIMCLLAIGVKLSSPGPALYRQTRVSWNGKPFEMLKFRSMPVGAEEQSGPHWTREDDTRATRFGRFLRRSGLDELPQFINVLKGDMSIVGPRPERPHFVEQFKDRFPGYMKKHLVKGGITGWAQVHGWRGNTDLAKRIEFDLYYIEHWSLWLDLRIMLMTAAGGILHRNAY
jgi:putative colanic acid biosynthesis UDP-glucose lipid carrier transferase